MWFYFQLIQVTCRFIVYFQQIKAMNLIKEPSIGEFLFSEWTIGSIINLNVS